MRASQQSGAERDGAASLGERVTAVKEDSGAQHDAYRGSEPREFPESARGGRGATLAKWLARQARTRETDRVSIESPTQAGQKRTDIW